MERFHEKEYNYLNSMLLNSKINARKKQIGKSTEHKLQFASNYDERLDRVEKGKHTNNLDQSDRLSKLFERNTNKNNLRNKVLH